MKNTFIDSHTGLNDTSQTLRRQTRTNPNPKKFIKKKKKNEINGRSPLNS